MGGGKKTKAPSAPDYTALAAQQSADSYKIAKDVTAWNRPTQYDAYGNKTSWSQVADPKATSSPEYKTALATLERYKRQVAANPHWDKGQINEAMAKYQSAVDAAGGGGGGGGTWTQRIDLTPETKENLDAALRNKNLAQGGLTGQLMQTYQPRFDASGFKTTPGAQPVYNEANGKAVSDAMYRSVMDRARPQQKQDIASMNAQLRQQGLQPGTQAYDSAMNNLRRTQGDVNAQAGYQATIGGYDEARQRYLAQLQGADQSFGQNLQSNAQNFGQSLAEYNQPYQNAAAFAALAGNPQQPSFSGFSGATGYNPADMLGAANAGYQAQMGGVNSSNAKKGSTLGSGLGFAGSMMGGK